MICPHAVILQTPGSSRAARHGQRVLPDPREAAKAPQQEGTVNKNNNTCIIILLYNILILILILILMYLVYII